MKTTQVNSFSATKFRAFLIALFFCLPFVSYADGKVNVNNDGVALSGYDPVSYFMSAPMPGYPALKYNYQGAIYQFENEENRQLFMLTPTKYTPAYGGWCAWAMLDGDQVDIDPLKYKIIDGKNYVFYNGFWGDTLAKWNKKALSSTDSALVQQADQQWQQQ